MSKELLKKERSYFIKDVKRDILSLILNFFQSLLVFLIEKPKITISTGAGVTFFICVLSKLFGGKVIFIESFSRVNYPSLTGRIVYHLSDLFIVQWEFLLKFYKKAVYGGSIF